MTFVIESETPMLNVRIARTDEFSAIASFYDEMVDDMKHSAFDPHWDREAHPSDAFLRSALEAGNLIVCEYDGELAGALVLDRNGADGYETACWNIEASNEEASVIHVLCTLPRFQGKGIARTLLRGALDIARERNQRCVRLDILPDNAPAQSLYESEGFVRICDTVLHYPDGSFESVLYECPLKRS